jgi:hypothetical protein
MKKSFILFSGIILFSCSQKTTETAAVETTVETKKATTEEIAQGKLLYTQYCIKCHQAYAPSDFTVKKWNHEVPEMAEKAKIDRQKSDLILAYVLNGAKP